MATAKSSKECMSWSIAYEKLNTIVYNSSVEENALLYLDKVSNYCRQPQLGLTSHQDNPWCFVYSGDVIQTESCDVPYCGKVFRNTYVLGLVGPLKPSS